MSPVPTTAASSVGTTLRRATSIAAARPGQHRELPALAHRTGQQDCRAEDRADGRKPARAAAQVMDGTENGPDDGDGHAKALESRKQENALTQRSGVTAAREAEDRGFEPRRVLPPNRISRHLTALKASVSEGKPAESAQLSAGVWGKAAKPGEIRRNPSRASIVPAAGWWR